MTTLRIKHSRGYTCIDNRAIRDKRLSFKARGLHHLLLSYPDDWKVNTESLSQESDKDGREAIASGIKELEKAGYIRRQRLRDKATGQLSWETVISELPINGFSGYGQKPENSDQEGELEDEPINGFSVDGSPVDGSPVDGSPVDGSPVDGKPVCIISNEIRSNDLRSTDLRSTVCDRRDEFSKTEPGTHGQALEVEILDFEPVAESIPTTAIAPTSISGESERIEAGQYSAAPDPRLLSTIAAEVLQADVPIGYVHPAAALNARMNPNAYPWKRIEPKTLKLFEQYYASVSGFRGETPQRKLHIAQQMILKANRAAIGSQEYQRVQLAWSTFVENAQKSATVAEATAQAPQVPDGWREFLRKRHARDAS